MKFTATHIVLPRSEHIRDRFLHGEPGLHRFFVVGRDGRGGTSRTHPSATCMRGVTKTQKLDMVGFRKHRVCCAGLWPRKPRSSATRALGVSEAHGRSGKCGLDTCNLLWTKLRVQCGRLQTTSMRLQGLVPCGLAAPTRGWLLATKAALHIPRIAAVCVDVRLANV